jgi:hypothetical protein
VTLVKANGQRFTLQAIVSAGTIFTEDPNIPIEDGDEFERSLPSGVVERYTVLDAGFQRGMPPAMPSHYQSKVKKNTGIVR